MTKVKICGLKDAANLQVAIEGGADYVGLVFYEPSPRFVSTQIAENLAAQIPDFVKTVGLFVDPADSDLEHILDRVKLDMIQLHGDETLERISAIKKKFDFEIIKAHRIASKKDIEMSQKYEDVADYLMFDARVEGESLPGGTGKSFDWEILAGHDPKIPRFLAGGLTPENVTKAIRTCRPDAVDVSSGVESARGIKDPEKIRAFLRAVKSA